MSVTVMVPFKNKDLSVYVYGEVLNKQMIDGMGSIFHLSGTGIIFYTMSNSRRAYIFQDIEKDDFSIPTLEGNIPCIKEKVRILYKATGRKFDLLKFFAYKVDHEYHGKPYSYNINYWIAISNYIQLNKKTNLREINLITEQYVKKREKKEYESY